MLDIIETPEYKDFVQVAQYFYGTKEYYSFFYANNYPVAYMKQTGIKTIEEDDGVGGTRQVRVPEFKTYYIYPIPISLYEVLGGLISMVLNLDEEKMQGSNPETIKMSYLDFLLYKTIKDNNQTLFFLLWEVLSQCLHLAKDKIDMNIDDSGKLHFYLDDVEIEPEEFDEIRNIILEQNNIEKVDLSIHPSIRQKLKEVEEFKRSHNKNKMCSFEDLKYRIMAKTGISFEEINKMSIRQFTKLLESCEVLSNYELEMILSPNLEKKDQQNIKHWLSDISKSKKETIEENSIEFEEMKAKLSI